MRTIEFIDDLLLSGLDNEVPPSEASTQYPTVHPGAVCGLFGVQPVARYS